MVWTDEETNEAVRLADKGWAASKIGKKLGKSRGAVIGRLYRVAHKRVKRGCIKTAPRWTDKELTRLSELAKKGLSCSEIGRQMGKTRNAVLGALTRLRARSNGFKTPRDDTGEIIDITTWTDEKLLDFWACIDPAPGEEIWTDAEIAQKLTIPERAVAEIKARLFAELEASEGRAA